MGYMHEMCSISNVFCNDIRLWINMYSQRTFDSAVSHGIKPGVKSTHTVQTINVQMMEKYVSRNSNATYTI